MPPVPPSLFPNTSCCFLLGEHVADNQNLVLSVSWMKCGEEDTFVFPIEPICGYNWCEQRIRVFTPSGARSFLNSFCSRASLLSSHICTRRACSMYTGGVPWSLQVYFPARYIAAAASGGLTVGNNCVDAGRCWQEAKLVHSFNSRGHGAAIDW